MPDYRKMYFQLAAKVADVAEFLIEAQQQGENDYVKEKDAVVELAEIGKVKADDKI